MSRATTSQYTHCLRCGRPLHSPASRARGYGPTCALRIRRATYSPRQVEAARELIADGGAQPLRVIRAGTVWATVSTDGTAVHRTTLHHCSCPAGRATRPRPCYHRAAVLLAA